MADLDDEFARFQAELASVEQEFAATGDEQGAAAAALPPPLAPPPVAPTATADTYASPGAARAPAAAAPPPCLAPPPLAPPPLAPPLMAPPPVPVAAPHAVHHPPPAGYQHHAGAPDASSSHRLHLLQQQQLYQQQQQQQQQQQHYMYSGQPQAAPAVAGGGGSSSGFRPGGQPDEAALRKLKEDLLNQRQDKQKGKKPIVRTAAGERWVDPTLAEWPENDHRIFVGDLGNEVNDELLSKAFQKYPSFAKAKVVRDRRTNKSKGYGFVSFLDGNDFAKAIKEMNGKYIGNRPCKLRKSDWQERSTQPSGGGKRKQPEGGGGPGAGPSRPKHKHHVSIAPRLVQQWQ